MRHRLTPLVFAAICAASPGAAQVRLIETGIYCNAERTGDKVEAPDTVAGYVWTITGAPFDVGGRIVPLHPGLSFGFRVDLKSDTDLPVRMVTRHPPMVEVGGRTESAYDTTLIAGNTHVRSFTFDFPYEMVPGTWTFDVWDADQLLLSVDFQVVDGPVASVDAVCATLYQS